MKFFELTAATDDDIDLDGEGVTFIDSAGIVLFLKAHGALYAQNRECWIENMSDRTRRTFDIVGVSDLLGFA